jgi:GDP/UDP-N,N'-diacetylbacillosamine 2-epimerase (hydrolysing)
MINHITIFTGSRGEWGYIRPVVQLLREIGLKFDIIVANMHLLPQNGFTEKEILSDGFEISERIYMNLQGPDEISWPKSLGLLNFQLPDVYSRLNTDLLLVAGDRAETFAAVSAAFYANIPIAHIQAGELSGHKDGMVRHAIGKLAHIHFASNEDAADRLHRFGEQDFRIHRVGAPQLDDIKVENLMSSQEIENTLDIDLKKNFAVCVVHPTSENPTECQDYVKMIGRACEENNLMQVWIYPNNDAGSEGVISELDRMINYDTVSFRNLNRRTYLSLINNSQMIIGNSSSGLLEAPSLKTAAINLGQRQNDRVRAESVIDVSDVSISSINAAIKTLSSDVFRRRLKDVSNPYGDGHSASRIVKILENTVINSQLLNKFVQE